MQQSQKLDFDYIEKTAYPHRYALVSRWLPNGRMKRGIDEYQALNPRRHDRNIGSFGINLSTLCWADFATGNRGKGLISFAAYIFDMEHYAAAREIAQMVGVEELAYE